MKLKAVTLDKTYIPEFNGNRDLPKEEQVTVEIKRHISNVEMSQYKKFISRRDGSYTIEYDDPKIMAIHVGAIKNLQVGDAVIKSGVDLGDSDQTVLYDLMIEIRNYLLNAAEALPEGES